MSPCSARMYSPHVTRGPGAGTDHRSVGPYSPTKLRGEVAVVPARSWSSPSSAGRQHAASPGRLAYRLGSDAREVAHGIPGQGQGTGERAGQAGPRAGEAGTGQAR